MSIYRILKWFLQVPTRKHRRSNSCSDLRTFQQKTMRTAGGTVPIVVEEQSGSRLRRGEQSRHMPGQRLVRAASSTKLFVRWNNNAKATSPLSCCFVELFCNPSLINQVGNLQYISTYPCIAFVQFSILIFCMESTEKKSGHTMFIFSPTVIVSLCTKMSIGRTISYLKHL